MQFKPNLAIDVAKPPGATARTAALLRSRCCRQLLLLPMQYKTRPDARPFFFFSREPFQSLGEG